MTNIVEQTTTKFPLCFYTLHYNQAGRSDWEFKGPLPRTNTPPTRTMTFDQDNRLKTFNGTSVSVDNDGNLTYGPLTNNTFGAYTYDARNELTSEGGLGYGYDPAGTRTSLTNGSAVTTFVVNPQGSQALMRIQNGTTNYYIYGLGLIYEIDVTASKTSAAFYHFDSRGSAVALTDANGNPTDLIEFLGTAIWIACGVVLSSRFGRAWGTLGYVFGFLAGFSTAFLLTWLILVTRNLLLMPFPECRRGQCRTFRGYVWKRGTIYGWEKGGLFRYRCKCGDEYVRDGNRFMEVLRNGTTRPYKKYQGGQWEDDELSQNASGVSPK